MERTSNGYNRPMENGHKVSSSSSASSLPWLDLKVFYVRVSECEIDDLRTPEYLIVKHVPLSPDGLLEVNGVRTLIDSDGASTFLRRDRLDKKSEEATFVSTDNVRTTGSMRFNVFHYDALVLHGELELRNHSHQRWSMKCELDAVSTGGSTTSFLKPKQFMGSESPSSPRIEVYVAGSFLGSPIILTKALHLNVHAIRMRKGAFMNSIPEHYENAGNLVENGPANGLPLQMAESSSYVLKPENEEGYDDGYRGMGHYYMEEGEDGELSWFNAGVRVGVGIGLSVCVGIGIGVGLLVRTYQGTTGNLRRRLF